MHSLQTRLFLAIALVTATALLAVGAFSTRTIALHFEWMHAQPPVLAATLSRDVAAWHETHHSWNGVERVLRGSGSDVLLMSADGRFIAASFPGVQRAALAPGNDSTIHVLLGGAQPSLDRRELLLQKVTGVPVLDKVSRTIAEIYPVRIPKAPPTDRVILLGRELWLAILCALAAALAVAVVLARNILAPVRRLGEATKAMHAGNLSYRVSPGGPAEIAQLAGRFNALAAHLERSEALRQRMIADIAHELRTPLTNIRGTIEAIEDGHMQPSEATLGSLAEEALLLERIVNDLQDLSLADAGQLKFDMREVSAAATVRAVIAAITPAALVKGITLTVEQNAPCDRVRADEARLRQIITNLVSNAIRLAPERSTIRVLIESTGEEVRVSVCDEGPGLAPESLQAVFERFYRADESRSRRSGGAGLGLAITKQLVEAQGGSIGVANNSGAGATFSFALPRY